MDAEVERYQVNGPRSDISPVVHSAEARSSTSVVEVLPTDHPIAPVEPPITEFVLLCSRKAGIEAAHNATSGGWPTRKTTLHSGIEVRVQIVDQNLAGLARGRTRGRRGRVGC